MREILGTMSGLTHSRDIRTARLADLHIGKNAVEYRYPVHVMTANSKFSVTCFDTLENACAYALERASNGAEVEIHPQYHILTESPRDWFLLGEFYGNRD